MRKALQFIFLLILLLLATLPWIIQGIASRPLLPKEFEYQREHYEATAQRMRDDVRESERRASPRVRIRTATPAGVTPGIIPPTQEAVLLTPLPTTAVPATTPTARVTIRQVTEVVPSSTITREDAERIDTPATGWRETTDRITEQMLAEQILQDAEDNALSELKITFHPENIQATGRIDIGLGITKQLEITGEFIIFEENLRTKITLVMIDYQDRTNEYTGSLESQINTNLYRLLPQRYIQSFIVEEGTVIVYSRMKP